MLADDDHNAARRRARSWTDGRVEHWWDEDKFLSECFQQTLGLHGPAWDLYLLYPPGLRWDRALPPIPPFWMHQLSDDAGASDDLRLDPVRLGRELDNLIQR